VSYRVGLQAAEVAGDIFSDSKSAPVPKFFNPVPTILQIRDPIPVQTTVTIIDPTLIYPRFYLRNDYTDSCYCRNAKVPQDQGPVFHKSLTPVVKRNF